MKTILITGAANGIGLHLGERAIKEGHRLIATDISMKQLKHSYENSENNILLYKLDVSKWSSWEKLMTNLEQKEITVDILMNIAGIVEPNFIYETSVENIDRQIDINLKGTIYGCRCFAPMMKSQRSGHIINISSMAGIAPIKGMNIYSATKFGVRGFSLAISQELKSFGVAVTVVCPDATKTPMLAYIKNFEAAAMTFSAPKYLSVEEIGDAIYEDVLKKKMAELWIPKMRGTLALFGSTFPKFAGSIMEQMAKVGRKKQQRY